MTDSQKPLLAIALVLAGVAAVVGASKLLTPHEIIPWRADLASAEAESARTHKPVFAWFTANWCDACQEMRRTAWQEPAVATALDDYVPVRIDVDEHPDLARAYHADALPALAVIGPDGRLIKSSAGAVSAEVFIAWLHAKELAAPSPSL